MSQTWTDPVGAADRPRAPGLESWLTVVGQSKDEVRRARRWLLATGVLLVLAGATAIAVPLAASVATAIFIGWVLVFSGAVMGVHAYKERSEGRTLSRALTALLTLVVGVFLLIAPLTGTLTLTVALAIWFFALGVSELFAAWMRRKEPGAGFVAFNGALSVLLGVLITVDLPSSAGWAIGLLVGISLLFWGFRAFVIAGLLKRLAQA
jgi:uncharacterized membrane protein HdeD (DUF308 family)